MQLTTFYALKELVDLNYIVVGRSSNFSKAIDLILPRVSLLAEDETRDRKAQIGAERLLTELQGQGLFRGLDRTPL